MSLNNERNYLFEIRGSQADFGRQTVRTNTQVAVLDQMHRMRAVPQEDQPSWFFFWKEGETATVNPRNR